MNLAEFCKLKSIKPKGILHVGACMLEEAQHYKDLGVDRVIWVEALPHDPARRARAAEFGHELHEFTPLSDRIETVSLRVASNIVSSSILPFKRHSEIYPDIIVKDEIPAITQRGDKLFNYFPPEIDAMCVDVQGAELKVLKGMGMLLDQINVIYAEVNLRELYDGCVLKDELSTWLKQQGFVNQEFFPVHLEEWEEGAFWR